MISLVNNQNELLIVRICKLVLRLPAGQAKSGPPISPSLAPYGVNVMEFVRNFNENTRNFMEGVILPVEVIIFSNKKTTFRIKSFSLLYLFRIYQQNNNISVFSLYKIVLIRLYRAELSLNKLLKELKTLLNVLKSDNKKTYKILFQ